MGLEVWKAGALLDSFGAQYVVDVRRTIALTFTVLLVESTLKKIR